MKHNETVKLICKANHDEVSARQVLQKLLSEASFIEIGSRKYARNQPSLVANQSVEEKPSKNPECCR